MKKTKVHRERIEKNEKKGGQKTTKC